METIDCEYLFYLQEDWLLTGKINVDCLNNCLSFMKRRDCEFMMSYIGNALEETVISPFPTILYQRIKCHFLQPAIWKKSLLVELVSLGKPLAEAEKEECTRLTSCRNCFCVFNEADMTHLTTKSFLMPHMHAIVGGKWTFSKYPDLKALVESYGIDTTTRGIDTTWMMEYS